MDVRLEIIKLLEKHNKLPDIGLGGFFFFFSFFFVYDTKSIGKRKQKYTSKWDFLRLKNFCTAKETTNKMKRKPTKREKIFANHLSVKELISKMYRKTHTTQ